MKPPSRFGKAGGGEELEEVGAAEPGRDVGMKDRFVSQCAFFLLSSSVC